MHFTYTYFFVFFVDMALIRFQSEAARINIREGIYFYICSCCPYVGHKGALFFFLFPTHKAMGKSEFVNRSINFYGYAGDAYETYIDSTGISIIIKMRH